jgi:hypothetical protein
MTASSAAKLLVLWCSLCSGACTLHVTTGPSSTADRGGYGPSSPLVVRSAPRPKRAKPAEPSSRRPSASVLVSAEGGATDHQVRPSSNAPVHVDRSLGAGGHLATGGDERVPPFVTSSHTSDPKRSLAAANRTGHADATRPVSAHRRAHVKEALPDDDGRYQRLAQRRDADAQPAGPSDD